MKITIDAVSCAGHGRCYSVAPELFEPDDEGRGVVVTADAPRELERSARRAVASCPERAVQVG